MTKLALIVLSLILLAAAAAAQNAKQPKMKTVRLHIDGFQKSKSGAV